MTKYELINLYIERAVASGEIKPRISLWDLLTAYPFIEYYPKHLPGAVFRLRRPISSFHFYESGKLLINASNERAVRRAVRKMKRLLEDSFQSKFSMKYKVNNVVGYGTLNEGLECGLLKSIFPDSKKAFGEGVRIYLDKRKNVTIFPSGKIVATGFDSEEMMMEELEKLVSKINTNLERANKEKVSYCEIERAEPLFRNYYDFIRKASEPHPGYPRYGITITFTDAERLLGRTHLETFLRKKAEEKDSLGATPETLAAAELYILSRLTNKTTSEGRAVTQKDLADITGKTDVSIRNGCIILRETLKDIFEEPILSGWQTSYEPE